MSRLPLSTAPLLLPAIALASGIFLASLLPLYAVAVALAIIAGTLIFKATYASAMTAIVGVGFVIAHALTPSPDTDIPDDCPNLFLQCNVTGITESNKGYSILAEATAWGLDSVTLSECAPLRIAISLTDTDSLLSIGDCIIIKGAPQKVIVRHDLPDEVTPEDFLILRHTFYRTIISSSDIRQIIHRRGLRYTLIRFASRISQLIYSSSLSPDTKIFLAATLVGDDHLLTTPMRESFARAGIAHVLALSGLHVGIIALLITVALFPLSLTGHHRILAIVTILLLWVYAIATGLSPSVTRAVAMASLFYASRALRRHRSALNSLSFAAIVILLCNPESLFDIGFQLSFAAVISIIIFTPVLTFVPQRHKLPYAINSFLAMSLSAMLGTSWLSILYFHTFPAYFLLANVATAILLPLVMFGGVGVILLQALGLNWPIFIDAVDAIFRLISSIAQFITSLPGSSIDGIYLPSWVAITIPATLLSLKIYISYRRPIFATLSLTAFLVTIIGSALYSRNQLPPTLFASSSTTATNFVIYQPADTSLTIVTTADSIIARDLAADAEFRYQHFMARHSIRHISIINDTTAGLCFHYLPPFIFCEGDTLALVGRHTSMAQLTNRHVRYLVYGNDCRLPLDSLLKASHPDTLLLGSDINRRRLATLLRLASDIHQPTIALSHTPFSLPL